jgi:hypothetical protein
MTSGPFKNIKLNIDEISMIKKVELSINRNIKGFPLAAGLDKDKRLEVMECVKEACILYQDEFKGKFYKLEGLEEIDRKEINNHIF